MTPSNQIGTPTGFILNYRRLSRAPNVKKTTALALAKETFKEDWLAYQRALSEGVALEPLDRKADYSQRRESMIRSGGILP